ncbi:cytochrome c-type biogenesis protein CcmH [Marinobacter salinisoli]|uniref:Cytochrome c-type biogenesis protein n=1 Tax=Marinobacter salinisoli TaxID=2769486 RepID=A0ABX7MVU7_9GAMM|nr:cytochrome c-type biogenesis protein [Marinobacter salinisoli]QSP94368.1 cytochrome c-type biogenesis protein CcmH [Marinobacter salinisoli]
MRGILLSFVVMLLSSITVANASEVYQFESHQEEQRFQDLTSELRCPKCQNQNIADSNSPISKDMRAEVYRMMEAGASDAEIVDALVARFGEFVRYKPQVEQRTILLWATPAIAVLGGLLVVAGVVIRSRRRGTEAPALTAEEKARADKILAELDRNRNA